MNESYKLGFNITVGGLILLLFAAIFWHSYSHQLKSEENSKIEEIIKDTIEYQVDKGLLIPEIIYINVDSSKKAAIKKQITESIKYQLIQRYTKDEPGRQETDSYYILPRSNDGNGNYLLTDLQLERIDKNIAFLTDQIDKETKEVKSEMNKNIEKLNTWVSIWIGVIGIFAIFIPVLLNFEVINKSSEAKREANDAKNEASNAKREVESALSDLEIVKTKSESAISGTSSSHLMLSVNRFNRIYSDLAHFKKEDRLGMIAKCLQDVRNKLILCKNYSEEDYVKMSLNDLVAELEKISRSTIVDLQDTTIITECLDEIMSCTEGKVKQEDIDAVVEKINIVISELKNDSKLI